jgi:long-chain acyl-CoA synthetase
VFQKFQQAHMQLVNLLQCDGIFQSKFGANDGAKGDRIVCALPLYIFLHLWFVRCTVCTKVKPNILIPNPRDLPAVINGYANISHLFSAVNTLFNALVNNEEFKQLDHSKLKNGNGRWYGGSSFYSRSVEENYRYQHY